MFRVSVAAFWLFFLGIGTGTAQTLTCEDWQDPAFWQEAGVSDIRACLADPEFLDQQDLNNWTPLHYAAAFSRQGLVVQILVRGGADMSIRNSEGQTPLQLAREAGGTRVIIFALEMLERSGLRRPQTSQFVQRSEAFAALNQPSSATRIAEMIAKGMNPDLRNTISDTLLIGAIRAERPDPGLVRRCRYEPTQAKAARESLFQRGDPATISDNFRGQRARPRSAEKLYSGANCGGGGAG